MVALTYTYTNKFKLARIAFARKRVDLLVSLIPRRCMVISLGLVLTGLGVPLLMTLELLPVTLFLALDGFALAAAGGLLVLRNCGEI
jgi:hypothetical protein